MKNEKKSPNQYFLWTRTNQACSMTLIDLLQIPDLILKLYVFISFLYELICRYLNLVKHEDNFIAN